MNRRLGQFSLFYFNSFYFFAHRTLMFHPPQIRASSANSGEAHTKNDVYFDRVCPLGLDPISGGRNETNLRLVPTNFSLPVVRSTLRLVTEGEPSRFSSPSFSPTSNFPKTLGLCAILKSDLFPVLTQPRSYFCLGQKNPAQNCLQLPFFDQFLRSRRTNLTRPG